MAYSYRIASIGSRSAAFLAGYHPKNTPVTVQTANDRNTLQGWMKMGQWATLFTTQLAPQPMITPIRPPVMLIGMASIGNWLEDVDATCTDRHAQTDLTGTLCDADVHDIHDADAAYYERYAGNAGEQCGHRGRW